MSMNKLELLGAQINNELHLTQDKYEDREQLLQIIEERVAQLLDTEPGLLFSYLYRLDVSENDVKEALNSSQDKVELIALLIYNRQLQRVETKLKIEQKPIDGWEW